MRPARWPRSAPIFKRRGSCWRSPPALGYDRDCPNVDPTRTQLREALSAVGLALRWQEWRRDDEKSPEYARRCGSPTILVDGCDIATSSDVAGRGACRLYADSFGRTSG